MIGEAVVRMLKQATGDLVDQFGKQANAGHVLDKSQQTISKFCDTGTVENVITLPDSSDWKPRRGSRALRVCFASWRAVGSFAL